MEGTSFSFISYLQRKISLWFQYVLIQFGGSMLRNNLKAKRTGCICTVSIPFRGKYAAQRPNCHKSIEITDDVSIPFRGKYAAQRIIERCQKIFQDFRFNPLSGEVCCATCSSLAETEFIHCVSIPFRGKYAAQPYPMQNASILLLNALRAMVCRRI